MPVRDSKNWVQREHFEVSLDNCTPLVEKFKLATGI